MATFRKHGKGWQYRIRYKDPHTNKYREKSKGGFHTKKEAQLAAAEVEKKILNNTYTEITEMTLGSFIIEWMNSVAKNNMRPSTFSNRKIIINKRIIPELGSLKIKEITPPTIQNFYNKLYEEGLSTSYVRTIHNLLNSMFQHAYKWDMIHVNIMDKVDAPKPTQKEMKTWNIDEINRFLKVSENEPTYIAFLLAIHTGMRIGEILGLRWKDIDEVNKTIHITQTLVRIGGKVFFQEPKTKNSRRQIAITSQLLTELKKHKLRQSTEADLVVTTELGTPYNPRNLLRVFDRLIKKAEVPKIRFHDLRHTHATLLLKLGENPKIVSERLGHSKVSITLDVYSHVLPDMQKQTAERFTKLLNSGN